MNFGFTFLEVLLSLMLMSLLFFNMDFMQLMTFRATNAQYNFLLATNLAQVLTEQLQLKERINQDEIINEWQGEVARLLPSGKAHLEQDSNRVVIVVTWGAMSDKNCHMSKVDGCLYVEF